MARKIKTGDHIEVLPKHTNLTPLFGTCHPIPSSSAHVGLGFAGKVTFKQS